MNLPVNVEIGAVLRQLRRSTPLTAGQASTAIGGCPMLVASYERGDRAISIDRFVDLARLYGTDPGLALDLCAARCRGALVEVS